MGKGNVGMFRTCTLSLSNCPIFDGLKLYIIHYMIDVSSWSSDECLHPGRHTAHHLGKVSREILWVSRPYCSSLRRRSPEAYSGHLVQ